MTFIDFVFVQLGIPEKAGVHIKIQLLENKTVVWVGLATVYTTRQITRKYLHAGNDCNCCGLYFKPATPTLGLKFYHWKDTVLYAGILYAVFDTLCTVRLSQHPQLADKHGAWQQLSAHHFQML